ncbi:SDR family NAD(P)-dependent oxidoreductase [Chloroflexota bacterium]
MKIDNSRIVLTGAASGIGQALLNQLATYPTQIVAVDINQAALQTAIDDLFSVQAMVTPYVCDLSQQANVDALFDDALDLMGGIDLFIANAGYAYFEKIGIPDWAHIAQIFQLNVFSAIYSAEKMRALNPNRPFKVVMTASAIGHLALPGYTIYAATKAALHRFAEGYRFELADRSALTLVYPIATRTHFFDMAGVEVPIPWPSQPAEIVARAVIKGIERDRASVYPSHLFQVFIVLQRFLPFLRNILQSWENRRFRQWLAAREEQMSEKTR